MQMTLWHCSLKWVCAVECGGVQSILCNYVCWDRSHGSGLGQSRWFFLTEEDRLSTGQLLKVTH